MSKDANKVITLTFDDGSQKDLDILFTYQLEQNGKNYVFVYDEETEQISVLEYIEKSEGEGEVLPVDPADEDLWEELEANETPEANFANALDRTQPIMLNHASQGKAWAEHGVALSQIMERNVNIPKGATKLWD